MLTFSELSTAGLVVIIAGIVIVLVFRMVSRSDAAGTPLPQSPGEPGTPHGNQRVVPAELERTPDISEVVRFPARASKPVTPFEDFNQRLFILEDTASSPWPELFANDFPTKLEGTVDWAREEIQKRLRPSYPTILDTYGWWADASDLLEMDPAADHPIVAAYLTIPVESRPVVISRRRTEANKTTGALVFFLYQFEPFELQRKYLQGHAAEALKFAMLALSNGGSQWWNFSVARMRKALFDRRRLGEQKFEEQLRRATHENRFAALWNLQADDAEQPETAA